MNETTSAAIKGQTFRKVIFLVPRYHTNMMGWVKGLKEHSVDCEVWVRNLGISEDYANLKPRVINSSSLYLEKTQSIRNIRKRFFKLRCLLIESNPNFVICRLELKLYVIWQVINVRSSKIPFILYSQWPIHGLKGYRKYLRVLVSRFLSVKFFSPVKSTETDWCFDIKDGDAISKINFIPFAIETSNLPNHQSRYEINASIKSLNLLSIGKFQSRKNHLELVQYFLANKLLISNGATLTIIGEVSTKEHKYNYDFLIETLSRSNLGNRVKVLVNVPYKECQSLLSSCNIFLLFSDKEPASVSNLEAMSMGKLVIVKSKNGTANYLRHLRGGFIVESINQLDDIFTSIFRDPNIILEMGQYNKSTIQEFCDPVKVTSKIISMFDYFPSK